MTNTASGQEALSHLKGLKPLGGWTIESKKGAFRLKRRNIAITDSYFLDIHHDKKSGCVVGMLSKNQAQVLVDKDGKLVGSKTEIVTVSAYDPNKKTVTSSTTTSSRPSATATTTTNNNTNVLTEEENKQLLQYAMYAVGAAIVLRIMMQTMATLSLLLVPCLYFYALQTCPRESSFDAKKELKRILRGHHLPENHPDKPKNFFDKTFSRISAAVATELATGLGYELSMMVSSEWVDCSIILYICTLFMFVCCDQRNQITHIIFMLVFCIGFRALEALLGLPLSEYQLPKWIFIGLVPLESGYMFIPRN